MKHNNDCYLKEPHTEVFCGKIGFFDCEENQITDFEYDETKGFFDGLAKVVKGGLCGYIDMTGKEVVPCMYDDIWSFCDGLARVRIGDKCGYVNPEGKEIVPCLYDDADNFLYGFARVCIDGKWGHINREGKIITSCRYADAENFNEGLSRVDLDGKIGFVNMMGEEVIPLSDLWIEPFSEGLAVVERKGKYGYMNYSGAVVIPLKYDEANDFDNGIAVVKSNGKWGGINMKGVEVVPFLYETRSSVCSEVSNYLYNKCVMTGRDRQALTFVESICEELESEMSLYPFQQNLLEDTHLHDHDKSVKENTHSRILKRLLEYNRETSVFNSFLQQFSFEEGSNLEVSDPKFRVEVFCPMTSGRIDILAQEQGRYAIIIENKINEAGDQPNQLARYINHLKSWYDENQIFVIYLTFNDKEPSRQTWIADNGVDYEPAFRGRFRQIKYSEIKDWLKAKVLPSIDEREFLYKSAVIQYIDYLECLYGDRDFARASDETLRRVLQNHIGQDVSAKQVDYIISGYPCSDLLYSEDLIEINDVIANIDVKRNNLQKIQDCVGNVEALDNLNRDLLSTRREALRQHIHIVEGGGIEEYEEHTIEGRTNHLGYQVRYQENDYYIYIGENPSYLFCSALASQNDVSVDPIRNLNTFGAPIRRGGQHWVATVCQTGDYYNAIRILQRTLDAIHNG